MKALKQTFAALACALTALTASAATVQIKFDSNIFEGSGYDAVHINFAVGSGTETHHVAAGRFQGTASQLDGISPAIFSDGVDDVFMYCYDVYQSINHGAVVKYTVNLNGETNNTLDFLGAVNAVMNGTKQFGDVGYDKFAWLHPVTANQGAAIQIGIWESKYDTNWSLTGGNFKAWNLDTATETAFNAFTAAMGGSASLDGQYAMVLESATKQDMITGDPPTEVPEPGSLALIGIALAGLAAAQRKKAVAA